MDVTFGALHSAGAVHQGDVEPVSARALLSALLQPCATTPLAEPGQWVWGGTLGLGAGEQESPFHGRERGALASQFQDFLAAVGRTWDLPIPVRRGCALEEQRWS